MRMRESLLGVLVVAVLAVAILSGTACGVATSRDLAGPDAPLGPLPAGTPFRTSSTPPPEPQSTPRTLSGGDPLAGGDAFAGRGPEEVQTGQQPGLPLFGDAPPDVEFRPSTQPWVVRSRPAIIDIAQLRAAIATDPATQARPTLQLNVFDDVTVTAVLDRIDPADEGFTWVGHIQDVEPSSVTLATVGSVMSGSIAHQSGVYAVRYAGNNIHEILEVDQSRYPDELDPVQQPGAPGPSTLLGTVGRVLPLDRSSPLPGEPGNPGEAQQAGAPVRPANSRGSRLPSAELRTSQPAPVRSWLKPASTTEDAGITSARLAALVEPPADDASTIDVIVLYTPAAATDAGGVAAVLTRINLGVSETNTSYATSGIFQRLRLVHTQQVTHLESNDLGQDLFAVSNTGGATELGNTAAVLRDSYKADLVMLLTAPSSPTGCGIAWLMTSVGTSFAPYGFSVVWQQCISPNFTFAHELGHNMGARHDWYVDNSVTPHTYAHGYVYAPDRWRTVMAYNNLCSAQGFNCNRLLSWANPGLTKDGIPMGIAGGMKSSCPVGDVANTDCDADDHRTLDETAYSVANFRQALSTCSYTVSPTSVSVSAAATSESVSVTTTTGCPWTAASNSNFLTIQSGTAGSGSGTVTYTVAANTGPARTGTLTVAGQTVTIDQEAVSNPPTLTPTPTSLSFAAVNTEGALTAQTPAQTVTLTQSGVPGVTWTVAADVSWLTITAADATGSGTFTVSLNNGATALSAGTTTATLTITALGAASHSAVPVRVTIYGPGGTATPFGIVDTPGQNATDLVGTIGVTGWVLDDVGIDSVRVYRNCLSFEPPINCAVIDGQNVVFVGDATLVAGARPDVESLYPTYPQADRAGWGYALLTNLAPHIPRAQMFGGQGPLTLYVRARDAEGHEAWLGRDFVPGITTQTDGVPTAFTMANDSIAKPFGTIDAPTQGQTVTASVWNFGWALTPDANTTGGEADDILMAPDGSTITVWVDGIPRGTVRYNLCRGTVGSPPDSTAYCNDDVSSAFGNQTPQPTYTSRTSNPTRYRNLDAGRGAIGAFYLNTDALTDGMHTITWSLYDSQSRGEGLGSRYFTLLKKVTGAPTPRVAPTRRPRTPILEGARLDAASKVYGRTGFDPNAALLELVPDAAGVRQVRLGEMDRVELGLGPVAAGHLIVSGQRRPLPVGSHLNLETGTFSWAPGVGFRGTYRLMFTEAADRKTVVETPRSAGSTSSSLSEAGPILVDVTIAPILRSAQGEHEILAHLRMPADGSTVSGPFTLAGWALDPQAAIGAGIGAVHVWAQRTDIAGMPSVFLGTASLGDRRPDVARMYGAQFETAGFSLRTDGRIDPGIYSVTVYAWSIRSGRWVDLRTVSVSVR